MADEAITITDKELEILRCWQQGGLFHPFTCIYNGDKNHHYFGGVLTPTLTGWECCACDYRQPYGRLEQNLFTSFDIQVAEEEIRRREVMSAKGQHITFLKTNGLEAILTDYDENSTMLLTSTEPISKAFEELVQWKIDETRKYLLEKYSPYDALVNSQGIANLGWIPAEQADPEPYQRVLVTVTNGTTLIGVGYTKSDREWVVLGYPKTYVVIAWKEVSVYKPINK